MSNWSALRYAPFRYLTAGRLLATAGNALAPIALAFAVLDLTGSAVDLGLVVGARSLANVALLLFGGVLADRVPRQLVLVVSGLLAMVTQAMVAVTVLSGSASIPVLAGLSAINGAVSAFAFPATAAMLPQTVPADLTQAANAINRLGTNIASIAGAAVGGLVIATVGPGWGIAIDAAGFGLAAGLFALIRVPAYRDPAAARESVLTGLRVGWREFVSRRWVWVVVLGACFFNACSAGAFQVLGPGVADHTIGRSAWGLVLASQAAGLVAGAFVAMRLRLRRMLLFGVLCGLLGALPLISLALLPVVVVLVPAAFITGMAIEQLGVAWEVSMQEHIPTDRLARVYSYDALGSLLAIPIGQVGAGPIASAVGSRATLLGAAGVMLVAVGSILASRSVRTLVHVVPGRRVEPTADPVLA